jgi:hypothetical protein
VHCPFPFKKARLAGWRPEGRRLRTVTLESDKSPPIVSATGFRLIDSARQTHDSGYNSAKAIGGCAARSKRFPNK